MVWYFRPAAHPALSVFHVGLPQCFVQKIRSSQCSVDCIHAQLGLQHVTIRCSILLLGRSHRLQPFATRRSMEDHHTPDRWKRPFSVSWYGNRVIQRHPVAFRCSFASKGCGDEKKENGCVAFEKAIARHRLHSTGHRIASHRQQQSNGFFDFFQRCPIYWIYW